MVGRTPLWLICSSAKRAQGKNHCKDESPGKGLKYYSCGVLDHITRMCSKLDLSGSSIGAKEGRETVQGSDLIG